VEFFHSIFLAENHSALVFSLVTLLSILPWSLAPRMVFAQVFLSSPLFLPFQSPSILSLVYLLVSSQLVSRSRLKSITQACTDFDVCIKLTVFEQFRPPDYENDFGFALSRLVFSQIVFS
jgi:hypothetical protein